jgi:hypothetical protein
LNKQRKANATQRARQKLVSGPGGKQAILTEAVNVLAYQADRTNRNYAVYLLSNLP